MYKLALIRKGKIKQIYDKALKTYKYVLKKGKKSVLHVNGKLSDAVGLNYKKTLFYLDEPTIDSNTS